MKYSKWATVIIAVFVAGFAAGNWQESKLVPKWQQLEEFLKETPQADLKTPARLFCQGENVTVNVVTPKSDIAAHYHETHEEVVYIIRGSGKMRLGDEVRELKPGDLIHIPKKCIHSVSPSSRDLTAISVFGPSFDGKDRVLVKSP